MEPVVTPKGIIGFHVHCHGLSRVSVGSRAIAHGLPQEPMGIATAFGGFPWNPVGIPMSPHGNFRGKTKWVPVRYIPRAIAMIATGFDGFPWNPVGIAMGNQINPWQPMGSIRREGRKY